MQKKLVCIFFALIFPALVFAQRAQDTLALDEVIRLSVKNNPTVLAAEQGIIIARQRVHEARFLNMPQLALSGTFSRVNLEYPTVLGPELGGRYLAPDVNDNFYTLRAYALQPIYTGGRNTSTIRLAQTAHNQARVDYETVKNDVVYNAKTAFYSVLYNKALNACAARCLARAETLAAGLKKDSFENIEVELALVGLRSGLELSKKNLESAGAALLKLLNREPGYQADITGEFALQPVNESIAKSLVTAMESRSEMKSEIYKAQMDDIAVNMALFRRNPNIYLGASYDVIGYKAALSGGAIKSNNWMASVGINFPLSYDIWTQVRQRKAQQRQGELKRVELQDNIRFEITSAYKDLGFWQKEAQDRKTVFERLDGEYETAMRNNKASMGALRSLCPLCDLEKKYLDSVYNQLIARIKLEWAQGRDLEQ